MQATQAPDPLAQLSDIHPPAEVATWPLDWGWWLVIAISVIVVVTLLLLGYRRYRFYQARREALALLQQVNADQPDWPARMNALLKRTAMTYFDSHRVAPLYGMAWMALLHASLPRKYHPQYREGLSRLSEVLYHQSPQESDFHSCKAACVGWLKHARLRATPEVTERDAQHV